MKKMKSDKEKEKFDVESKVIGLKARQHLLGADLCISLKHMAGLPLAEGSEVFVYRCTDKIIFERNQETFELPVSKVKDVLMKTSIEIQKSYSSSIGGAVGGYVLFGPLGAMVGGRTKEKESKVIDKYLIFSYVNSSDEIDFISFEATSEPKAIMFNNEYYNLKDRGRVTVEL